MQLRERFDATDKKYYQISFMGEDFEEERALMFSNIDVLALIQCYYTSFDSCLGALGAERDKNSNYVFISREQLRTGVSLFWSESEIKFLSFSLHIQKR